jgi:hypothetical protein
VIDVYAVRRWTNMTTTKTNATTPIVSRLDMRGSWTRVVTNG